MERSSSLNLKENGKAKGGSSKGGRKESWNGAPVGRLVDSSQAEDRRVIRLVRARRLLYARTNMPVASYYEQVKRLWKEVADEMHWTVADVRRKWSHIRNSYSRHLRNELNGATTGRGRAVSRWYLADELEFLREHMATDTRTPQYPAYAPSFLKMDLTEGSQDSSSDTSKLSSPWFSALPEPATPGTPGTPAPPSAMSSATHDVYSHLGEDSSSSFSIDENTSYFQFFRGIYTDYQELSTRKQRQFKRQALIFLHDLLDEEDTERGGLPPGYMGQASLEGPRREGIERVMGLPCKTESETDDEPEQKPCVPELPQIINIKRNNDLEEVNNASAYILPEPGSPD